MSKHRRAAKVDANQAAIVKALRQIPGVTVQTGHDDIICGYQNRTFLFEIKASEKSPVTKSQKKMLAEWTGHYQIVWNIDQILETIGVTK